MACVVLGGLLSPPAAAQPDPTPAPQEVWIYTVRPGDDLWTVSRDYLHDVRLREPLQALNGITDPRRLRPGTRLRVPFAWLKARPAPARVEAVRGEAVVIRAPRGERTALVVGLRIDVGDRIVTGSDGSATITFADGGRLLLGGDSELVFDRLSAYGSTGMVDTSLRLERGRAETRVTPRRGRFQIWTPAAATVVRGPEFRTTFDTASDRSFTEVLDDQVEVSAAGLTLALTTGQGTVVEVGEPPSPPVPLLPAPDLSGLPAVIRQVPIELDLPPVPGAAAYRIDVAADGTFSSLIQQGLSQAATVRIADLADGAYALRVRAVDAQGLGGFDAVVPLVVDARPEPPVLIEPSPGAIVRIAQPTLRWSRPADASGFRVEVSRRDESERTPLSLAAGGDGSLTLPTPLGPGRHAWRVATVSASGDEGPFSAEQEFTFRPPPGGPDVEAPAPVADGLVLRWAGGSPGDRFRLQLARDPAFDTVVTDLTVDEAGAEVPRLPPGAYYLRVKIIEPDGFEGPYGPTQTFEVPPPDDTPRRWPWFLLPIAGVILLIAS